MEKWNIHTMPVGTKSGATSLENSLVVPQKGKYKPTRDPAIPLLGLHLRETKAYVHTKRCESAFIEVLFMIAPNWEQPNIHHLITEVNGQHAVSPHWSCSARAGSRRTTDAAMWTTAEMLWQMDEARRKGLKSVWLCFILRCPEKANRQRQWAD